MDKDGKLEKDETVLVTVRCIDMAAPTSEVDRKACSECGEMTWVSFSSRNQKFDKILCEPCFFKSDKFKDKDFTAHVTEKCLNSALEILENRGIRTTKEEMVKNLESNIGKKLEIERQKKKRKER
jgi:hypothetical protein